MTDSSDFAAADNLARLMPRTKTEKWILKWFVPDLSLALVFLILLYALFVLQAQTALLRDSDTGWHIRTGERILAGSGIPRTDPYSFTKSGEPWRAWEWASEAVMGWMHQKAGLRGIVWCSLIVIGFSIWSSLRLTWLAGGDFLLAALMLPAVISSSAIHWLARPHMLSWIWFILTLIALESWSEQVRFRHGVIAFLMGMLWANTHASFMLGLGAVLLYAMGEVLSPPVLGTVRRGRLRLYGVLFACGMVGTFANPFGWSLHTHALSFLANRELLRQISEYQTYDFQGEGSWLTIAVFFFVSAGASCALLTKNFGRALLQLALFALALRSARVIPMLGLAMVPIANASLLEAFSRWQEVSPSIQTKIKALHRYSGNLRLIDQHLAGWALMIPLIAVAWVVLGTSQFAPSTGFPKATLPVDAAEHVKSLPDRAQILSTDQYGGYLIYRYAGERKVFFDGRWDFYGLDNLKDYTDLIYVQRGWEKVLRKYDFTHALLPVDCPLGTVLELAGWRVLHKDEVAVLLEIGRDGRAGSNALR